MRSRHLLGWGLLTGGLCFATVVNGIGDLPIPQAVTDPVSLPLFNTSFRGARYETGTIDPAKQDLRLYWDDGHGNPLGNFTALEKQVKAEGGRLLFAANAGMFDPTSKPVGLLVQNGDEKFPLNLADGYGNFFMKPNGVFVINAHQHALIVDSENYPALAVPALWATQSGPLLVHGGDLNPDFIPNSKNLKIRSGVGVTKSGEIIFALSKSPVDFYAFAEFFREKLGCPNALYLDGDISDFWTRGDVEKENQHHFGPMIGVVLAPLHEGVTAAPAAP
jgi:uncharacterized protein YigE (DUF2233 family)